MSCENCPKALPAPICAENLNVGEVSTANPVYVYFESIGTGRLNRYEATPVAGVVVIDTPQLAINTSYRVWINEQTTETPSEGLDITLDQGAGTTVVECYLFRFTNPQQGDYTTVKVTLEE